MGIYTTKFALESTADVIQTPDDVGVDLDQVEKAIMGPDGIEGHRSDIDDAVEGVIGDPLDEVYMIMYESQYNYNRMIKAIGLHELSESSYARNLVLEAFDIKSFFTNVKNIIVNMFKRITSIFKKSISRLEIQAKADKEFVKENKTQIIEGGKKNTDEFMGYPFPGVIAFDNKVFEDNDLFSINTKVAHVLNGRGDEVELEPMEVERAKIIKGITGFDTDNIEEMNKRLILKLHGGVSEKIDLRGKIKPEDVIYTLSNNQEIDTIKSNYSAIKKTYDVTLNMLNNIEKNISAQIHPDDVKSKAMAVCNHYTKLITFEMNVQSSVYAITLRTAEEKRNQARAMAKFFKGDQQTTAQHNSAYIDCNKNSVFSNLQFI